MRQKEMLYPVLVQELERFGEKQRSLFLGLDDLGGMKLAFFRAPRRVGDDVVELQVAQSRGSVKQEVHLVNLRINR